MLILSRRVGQMLCIGDNIKIVIIEIEHGQAKIGIDAPKDIAIDRLEIRRRKDAGLQPGEIHVE